MGIGSLGFRIRLSFVLACMPLCLAPAVAFAEEQDAPRVEAASEAAGLEAAADVEAAAATPASDFEYVIKIGDYGYGAYITGYKGTAKSVVVPKSIGKADVVSAEFPPGSSFGSLDVQACASLKRLDCPVFRLETLDVSKNTLLESLDCAYNSLESLDLSQNKALDYLDCSGNSLQSLNTGSNPSIAYLDCRDNEIRSLDLSGNPMLVSLMCGRIPPVVPADGSEAKGLEAGPYGNLLTTLDLSKNLRLKKVECNTSRLTSIDVSKCTELEDLDCDNNNIASIDLSKNGKLRWLSCGSNALTALDTRGNGVLEGLYCAGNRIASLDVSKSLGLKVLRCGHNALTSLDISACTELEELECSNNKLASLDISKNKALRCVYGDRNYIADTSSISALINSGDNWGAIFPQLAYTKSSYTDLSVRHWGFMMVEDARRMGCMTGDGSGNTFRPDDTLTRAEAVTALWKAAGRFSGAPETAFSDTPDDWYQQALNWAVQAGIATGYEDSPGSGTYSRFGPSDPVTREQLATFLARYAGQHHDASPATDTAAFDAMPDKGKVSSFAKGSVAWAMQQKIITGRNGRIAPRSHATRAEAATMIVRSYGENWVVSESQGRKTVYRDWWR